MRFLIIFIFFISSVLANETPNIKNIVVNKELKTYDNITFLDSNKREIKLSDYRGKLVLLNFWATWCLPCKEEMPSLDDLKNNPNLDNLEVFAINVGKDSLEKSNKFFEDLSIKNLNIYFDNSVTEQSFDSSISIIEPSIDGSKLLENNMKIVGLKQHLRKYKMNLVIKK